MGKKKALNSSENEKTITKIQYEIYQKRETTLKRLRGNLWTYAIIMVAVGALTLAVAFLSIINSMRPIFYSAVEGVLWFF